MCNNKLYVVKNNSKWNCFNCDAFVIYWLLNIRIVHHRWRPIINMRANVSLSPWNYCSTTYQYQLFNTKTTLFLKPRFSQSFLVSRSQTTPAAYTASNKCPVPNSGLVYARLIFLSSWTTIVVHNRDQLEIYENPLIERTITGLMGHIEKQT